MTDARTWAAVWKKAAKFYRDFYLFTYDAAKRHQGARFQLQAENARLRKVIEQVEWVYSSDEMDQYVCPWCDQYKVNGHAPDCSRQAALAVHQTEIDGLNIS
jgi:hypothetical protein